MLNARHLLQGEVAQASAGVDKDVVIDQKRGGTAVFGDGARAAQYTYSHALLFMVSLACNCLFVFKAGGAVPCGVKGQRLA